jgi:hypothetical protein
MGEVLGLCVECGARHIIDGPHEVYAMKVEVSSVDFLHFGTAPAASSSATLGLGR